ncbi:uncharacterized protein MYCFIDRAFT_173939 [Pseudocercospora fijiensis CIRAD86]|uniref:Uncharacterized protein n=1 Tax=Pseudocercospora fijiensis (strain CIRAD86) TaxID=383855 RepID=M3A1L4_PSEFD|nr:uncharacterized protein MYCFIDRAFT_173939 [Pseudocercospora fijiensis CIRAD86]EME85074.1 hypothetical protein MYCFIDRAFT_173939 [Pseudocercospora fijiensis CIRAD86]
MELTTGLAVTGYSTVLQDLLYLKRNHQFQKIFLEAAHCSSRIIRMTMTDSVSERFDYHGRARLDSIDIPSSHTVY